MKGVDEEREQERNRRPFNFKLKLKPPAKFPTEHHGRLYCRKEIHKRLLDLPDTAGFDVNASWANSLRGGRFYY